MGQPVRARHAALFELGRWMECGLAPELIMARRHSVAEDDDIGAAWKDYRQAQQDRRALRLPIRTEEILALRQDGFDVRQLTEYQFRVDGKLDLYPTHRRYHDIATS